jgi:TolB-like protein/tetratricopeptide (TPR) repeat protein
LAEVFISYARKDRVKIQSLATVLEACGHSVWWDHNIEGGSAFAAEIERALNASKAVIVAWSVNAVQSEWVIDEASLAKETGKLVPILLDATRPPIGFRQYQTIDFSSWDGSEEAPVMTALVHSIARFAHRRRTDVTARPWDEDSSTTPFDAIAVLPFENFSGDPGQQFFVDGMHEALIADLSKVSSLKIISRTSTRAYAGSSKPLREIGAELGASRVIEGSVIRFGDDVRIRVQLIDAHTDTHLWSESFDRDMSHILRLQSEVSRAIVQGVSAVLTPAEEARLGSVVRVRPEAYEAYLKGMYHWYKLTPHDLQLAFDHFNTALAADPDYAPAWAGIAAAWAGLQQMGASPTAVAGPKIKSAADKALQLDPNLAQAHFTMATYYTWAAWDWARAEPAFQRAIELNPNFPDAYTYYAHYLNIIGRFDEAESTVQRALDLDPFNPLIRSLYAVCLMFWDRYDEALAEVNSVLSGAPDHWLAYQISRLIYHERDMLEEAFQANRSLYSTLGNPAVVDALDRNYSKHGYQSAMAAAADELARQAETHFILPTQIAFLYGFAQQSDKALDWLEKALEVHDPDLPYQKHLRRFPQAVIVDPRNLAIIKALHYPDA